MQLEYSRMNLNLRLEKHSNLTLDLESSFPLEGEYKIRPYENLGIVRMDSGPSRTPSCTHIKTRVLDGVPMGYHRG